MKKLLKRCLSVILLLCITISPLSNVSAEQENEQQFVTIDVERFTIGQGYFIEPVHIPYTSGDTAAKITLRLFERYGVEATGSGMDGSSGFYLASIKGADSGKLDIPEYITKNGGPSNEKNDGNADGYLGEKDYSGMSGWMISVNHTMINVGAGAYKVKPGDVIRWQFTLWGYGADLGLDTGWGHKKYYTEADKSALLADIADINENHGALKSDAGYQNAYSIASSHDSSQEQVDDAKKTLDSIIAGSTKKPADSIEPGSDPKEKENGEGGSVHVKELSASIDELTKQVSNYMLAEVSNPQVGSIGGEWAVLQLARSGCITENFKKAYLNNAGEYIKKNKGILSTTKYTEYSRVTLALTALGEDARTFAGYDILEPLDHYSNVSEQGISNAIFQLIAMDAANYEFRKVEDEADQNSREKIIQYILSNELKDGGWSFLGDEADVDLTAMAIQALAKYYSTDAVVKEAVDRGLTLLSKVQKDNGGYVSWGSVNSESIAQVIVALCALGIDPAKDTRFIKKDGSWLLSGLMEFAASSEKGTYFGHTDREANQMATEQAAYAITAYNRLLHGQKSLYDMSDVQRVTPPADDSVVATGECGLVIPSIVSNTVNTVFNVCIRVGSVAENTKVLQTVLNVSPYVDVINVQVCEQLLGGNLDYNLSDNRLRIAYGDFTEGYELEFEGEVPVDLITVSFRIKEQIPDNTPLVMSIEEMKQLVSSDEIVQMNDISGVTEIPLNSIGIRAEVLYQGDGVDLIPADKIAVKITMTGLTDVTKQIGFNCEGKYASLYESTDFTKSSGVQTYLMIVDAATKLEDLLNSKNYKVYDDVACEKITFGDTNSDNYIDAQDALNIVTSWLRKGDNEVTSKLILSYNVTGDRRIDTQDALSITEKFILKEPFKIMMK